MVRSAGTQQRPGPPKTGAADPRAADQRPGRRWRGRLPILLLAPLALFYGVFLFGPVISSFLTSVQARADGSLSGAHYRHLLTEPFYLEVLWRTVRISLIVLILCMLIGFPLARLLVATTGARSRYLRIVIILPVIVSHAIIGYGWMVVLGSTGLVNSALQGTGLTSSPVRLLFTEAAIVIGCVYTYVPFMALSIETSLRAIDPAILRAARDLGAPPRQVTRRIVVPLSLPGIIAGSALVLALVMSTFAMPAFLGGSGNRVMATLIHQNAVQLNEGQRAAALAVILLAGTAVLLVGYQAVLRRVGPGSTRGAR